VTNPSDDRSALAIAYEWAARIIVISLEMVLPGVIGYGIDYWLGTVCLFLVIGLVAGSIGGMRHLLQMTRPKSGTDKVDR
jgi:F0F1-type ATP synthase assembly protein I